MGQCTLGRTFLKNNMDISSNEDSDLAQEPKTRCSYCNKEKTLSEGRTYCLDCATNCYRECKRCKRPIHDKKYYAYSETRCNSCHKKYLKERAKRDEKKKEREDKGETTAEGQNRPKSSHKIAGYVPVYFLGWDEVQR